MMDILFGITFGSLGIIYGVLVIIDPVRFTLNTINDAWQKALYGEKLYRFLGRFIGGPLCIGFGVLFILAALGLLEATH